MAPPPTAPARKVRILEPDFWRGIALLLILIFHLPPSALQVLTVARYGISDAAAWFFLLSGFVAHLVYVNTLQREGPVSYGRAVLKRCATLYGAHLVLSAAFFAAAFIMAWAPPPSSPWWAPDSLLPFVTHEPWPAALEVATLQTQYFCGDILPCYIIILLIFFSLHIISRATRLPVIGLSAALYCLVQLDWVPVLGTRNFNPLAWQFIFHLGGWLYAHREGLVSEGRHRPWLLLAAWCTLLLYALVDCRFQVFPAHIAPHLSALVIEGRKPHLGLPYLGHALLLAFAFSQTFTMARLKSLPGFKVVCLFGANSLPVYIITTSVVFFSFALFGNSLGLPAAAGLIMACAAISYAWIYLTKKRAAKPLPPTPAPSLEAKETHPFRTAKENAN